VKLLSNFLSVGDHNPPTSQTDGRTDRRHSHSNTAYTHVRAYLAVKITGSENVDRLLSKTGSGELINIAFYYDYLCGIRYF